MIDSSKISVPNIFIGAFIAFLLSAYLLNWAFVSKLRIAPEATLGFTLPKEFPVISSLKAAEGTTVSFFNPDKLHKFSIARSKLSSDTSKPITGAEIISGVIAYQKDRSLDPRVAPLTIKYVSAEFDARRAYGINSETRDGTEITRFQTNNGANYGLALVRAAGEEIVVLAFHKDSPVDLDYMAQVIHEVQGHARVIN